ncbi:hydroxymethylbilane synthase [Oceanicella sp. SM1341]|uniref:hydroxymethylbilane synthase n=1 Tax=Oceanicella sp. SM1341 TaxID=1548889 RepID=UPI000E4FF773|nr:hydroxymethylbilane synthase [Oceanicella sp. SM1341]
MTPQCSPAEPLCIGTRGSPLALAQAEQTRDRLMAAHGLPQDAFLIKVIRTTGDAVQDRSLAEIGGKGLFTKEIEEALLSREIDIAVHSMKDVATLLPEGLVIDTVLPRADVRDAFISARHASLEALPQGATVGTSSLRRRAQLLAVRPDLQVVEFRGNVQTRLKKLETGVAEATFLACAGLERLGREGLGTPLPVETVLPAPAQGAIGIERRADDDRAAALLAPIGDAETAACVAVERAFLAALDGSCRTPIAALARLEGGTIRFRGEILRPDGTERHAADWSGPEAEAAAAARALGEALRDKAGDGFFG